MHTLLVAHAVPQFLGNMGEDGGHHQHLGADRLVPDG